MSQIDCSMQEDSVCGGLLPSVIDNQYDFFQQDDLSAFNNTEQSHYPYLAQDPASGFNNTGQPHYSYLQGSASGFNNTEQSHYLAQGLASIPSIFQGNSSFFDMGDEMKGWDNNVWG